MDEEIVLSMAEPYVQDGCITYSEFESIFDMLSLKEQYQATEILFRNDIELVDQRAECFDDNYENEDDFEILYDESLFTDQGISEQELEELTVNKNVKQSNEILCHLIQSGNRQAEQDLCTKNSKLVDKYVFAYQKMYGNRLDFEDLEQAGFIGLLKAGHRFDSNMGTAFSTYAVFWIKQSIAREIMDNGFVIRVPVHMMERINKIVSIDRMLLEDGLSIEERIASISDESGFTEDAVRECLAIKANFLTYSSLDVPVGAEEETELMELIPDDKVKSVEDTISETLLREKMFELLDTLTEREAQILKLRYGLVDGKARTLEEVGREFGVTRERIRQIENKALIKLRHPVRIKYLKGYI